MRFSLRRQPGLSRKFDRELPPTFRQHCRKRSVVGPSLKSGTDACLSENVHLFCEQLPSSFFVVEIMAGQRKDVRSGASIGMRSFFIFRG